MLGRLKGFAKNFVKFNPGVRKAYRRVGSALLGAWGALLPIEDRRMLLLSFGGRQYSDSPRALYEALVQDPFFQGWEIAWAFVDPDAFADVACKRIRVDTPAYFRYALTSRVWITNTSICRDLQFKKEGTVNLNTWHGFPLKKLGNFADKDARYRERVDIGCCQNGVDREVFRRIFDVRDEDLMEVDLPRNDALLRYGDEDVRRIKRDLGIPPDKTVLLYMPTYREYNLDEGYSNYLVPPIDLARWERELGDDCVLLVRFHYLVEKALDIPASPFCVNVTHYAELNDLYAVADVLVSDYSSSYVDYSILQRPMLCFAYDYDEYEAARGFEVDYEEVMPCRIDRTEDELLESIRTLDVAAARERAAAFHERFTPHAGHATQALIAELKRRLAGYGT